MIFPEGYESVEIKNEINKIEQYEKNIQKQYDLLFKKKTI